MWKTVKPVLRQLLTSKKFLAFLAGVLVWVLGKAGLQATESDLLPVLGMIATYILGQGIADHGKEAAKVHAAVAKELQAGTSGTEGKAPAA